MCADVWWPVWEKEIVSGGYSKDSKGWIEVEPNIGGIKGGKGRKRMVWLWGENSFVTRTTQQPHGDLCPHNWTEARRGGVFSLGESQKIRNFKDREEYISFLKPKVDLKRLPGHLLLRELAKISDLYNKKPWSGGILHEFQVNRLRFRVILTQGFFIKIPFESARLAKWQFILVRWTWYFVLFFICQFDTS